MNVCEIICYLQETTILIYYFGRQYHSICYETPVLSGNQQKKYGMAETLLPEVILNWPIPSCQSR